VIPPGAARPARTVSTGNHVSGPAMAPDGTLYAAYQDSATGQDVVGAIPPGANAAARTIQVSSIPGTTENPHGIATGPDGTIYVASISSNHVAVIEPGAETVAYNIYVPGGPQEAAVGQDGTLYVTGVLNRVLSVVPPVPRPRAPPSPPTATPVTSQWLRTGQSSWRARATARCPGTPPLPRGAATDTQATDAAAGPWNSPAGIAGGAGAAVVAAAVFIVAAGRRRKAALAAASV
jgi:YVTN family beta-propeller protein